jgi:DNA (cytosine-5)-methyltransferase 1
MKILNLYAGIGGNRALWKGHNITAVENHAKVAEHYAADYPADTMIIGDAHEYLREHVHDFDFIWSSPPCQTHSKMRFLNDAKYGNRRYVDMSLYQEILFLEQHCKARWVVENVRAGYKPLIPGLIIGRHSFWGNYRIPSYTECAVASLMNATHWELEDWLGIKMRDKIYRDGNHDPLQQLRNCVHPRLGLHVLDASLEVGWFPPVEKVLPDRLRRG